jgi:hypothetical protein
VADEKRQPEPLQEFHPGNVELICLRFKKISEARQVRPSV